MKQVTVLFLFAFVTRLSLAQNISGFSSASAAKELMLEQQFDSSLNAQHIDKAF